jgi:hypothetical protein
MVLSMKFAPKCHRETQQNYLSCQNFLLKFSKLIAIFGKFLAASKYCKIMFFGKKQPQKHKKPPFWNVNTQKVPFRSNLKKIGIF